ncbi:MAG: ABC transporter permease [Clostridia bacterium]|nr:ABC transporter permease [Clostridia bacterium]
MGIGFAAFIGLLIAYIHKNRGFRRPIFASPYVLWLVIFTVIPCFLVAYFSFTDPQGNFTLDNFKSFWDSNYNVRKAMSAEDLALYESMGLSLDDLGLGRDSINIDTLVFSLWMAFLCTAICLLLGYPAAHIMADREFKLGPTLVILFVVPMWMNFLLRTIALMSLLEDNGVVNNVLEWIGVGRQKLLNNISAVQAGMVYNFLPFMVFPIYNVLNKMDYKLSEAAMDLGCDKWHVFYKVTLPLSVPGVVSGITMVFMPAVTTFYISRLLGGGKVQLFGDLIEAKFLSTSLNEWNVGSALSLLMMILILLSLGLLNKVDPEGEGGGMI